MTTTHPLIPWPDDAIMIVAALAGEQRDAEMEAVVECICRHCGRAVAADSRTIRVAAASSPAAAGRSDSSAPTAQASTTRA